MKRRFAPDEELVDIHIAFRYMLSETLRKAPIDDMFDATPATQDPATPLVTSVLLLVLPGTAFGDPIQLWKLSLTRDLVF
jgi:hypothetical protein